MVKRLSRAFALAVPREETQEITPHLAFFQRIAVMIRKRLADDAGPTPGGGGSRDIDAAVDAGEVIESAPTGRLQIVTHPLSLRR